MARRPSKKTGAQNYLPFQQYQINFFGSGELKSLKYSEYSNRRYQLKNSMIFCGFYLNELSSRSLKAEFDSEAIFSSYVACLSELSNIIELCDAESALRRYELVLLRELGLLVDYQCDAASGEQVKPRGLYHFTPEFGFVDVNNPEFPPCFDLKIPGEILIKIAAFDFSDAQTRSIAKRLLRYSLRPVVGDRPFKSRELFRH